MKFDFAAITFQLAACFCMKRILPESMRIYQNHSESTEAPSCYSVRTQPGLAPALVEATRRKRRSLQLSAQAPKSYCLAFLLVLVHVRCIFHAISRSFGIVDDGFHGSCGCKREDEF